MNRIYPVAGGNRAYGAFRRTQISLNPSPGYGRVGCPTSKRMK